MSAEPFDWPPSKKNLLECIQDMTNFVLEQTKRPSQPDTWLLGWDEEKGILLPGSRKEIETADCPGHRAGPTRGVPICIRGQKVVKIESVRT